MRRDDLTGRHFTIEDYEKYMSTDDMSDAYLVWYEKADAHLESCNTCRKFVEKMLQVDTVSAQECWAGGLRLLQQEESLRAKLLAQKLILTGTDERIFRAAALLSTGRAESIFLYKKDLLRRQVVARGSIGIDNSEEKGETQIQTAYADGRMRIKISGGEPRNYTVILSPVDEVTREEPLFGEAVWSLQENAAIAEFSLKLSREEYRIYLV